MRLTVSRSSVLAAVLLAAGLVAAVLISPAQAASLVGKPCSRAGATMNEGPNRTLVCTKVTKGKNKGKLIWKLAKPPTPPPTPAGSIPAVIQSWGISVAPYDSTTKRAGDMYVGSIPFPSDSVMQAPIEYYGAGPRRPSDPPGYVDPQMTFFVPQGTKVRAVVSGTVCSVKYLNTGYSDDYSIGLGVSVNGQPACQVDPMSGQGSGTIATWEHEHVMAPLVKVGDKVAAGQVIATASYYTEREWLYSAGYALYEIGILAPSPDGRPMHVCPALYLDPTMKARMLKEMADAARAYEANTGTTHYAPKTLETGCVSEMPAYG